MLFPVLTSPIRAMWSLPAVRRRASSLSSRSAWETSVLSARSDSIRADSVSSVTGSRAAFGLRFTGASNHQINHPAATTAAIMSPMKP